MKNAFLFSSIAYFIIGFGFISCGQSISQESIGEPNDELIIESSGDIHYEIWVDERKEENAQKAMAYLLKNKGYNQDTVILIDMRIPSKNNRFFVYDLTKNETINEGLVAHGSGSVKGDSLIFSNVVNSYMTSLGKYKIGKSYSGNFGKSYKLHGLDETNNNAFKRYVVLHPYYCVPDEEQDQPICESLGCTMVSPNFMKELIDLIDGSTKPMLMLIYY